MRINVIQEDITKVKTPALVISLFQGTESLDDAASAIDSGLDGTIKQLINDGEIKGKEGELTLIHTFNKVGAERILVLGLGKEENFSANVIRNGMGDACRFLRTKGVESMATTLHGSVSQELDPQTMSQAMTEGAMLGLYRFQEYFDEDSNSGLITVMSILSNRSDLTEPLQEGVKIGEIISRGTMLSRDLSSEPANIMTPSRMAEVAQQISDTNGLEINILERSDMEKLGMGALLGVAKGSYQPPKLIVLKYNGDPNNPSKNLGIIGKGITFDSGGISIKGASGMERMKGDMSGGASVLGAMQAIAELRPKVNVTGIVPATENMPGGQAQRPGDIVRAMNGKTIEIINTDAEGRLVLADALVYAIEKMKVDKMVDIATLTGAIKVALGSLCTGVMGNDQEFIDLFINSSTTTGEQFWQLPMHDKYADGLKSTFANLRNTGSNGEAGSITAAKFIEAFVGDTPWIHLDIAGTARSESNVGYLVKGYTGVPVRTLVNLAISRES
jgi:leucyl aminopeptidase